MVVNQHLYIEQAAAHTVTRSSVTTYDVTWADSGTLDTANGVRWSLLNGYTWTITGDGAWTSTTDCAFIVNGTVVKTSAGAVGHASAGVLHLEGGSNSTGTLTTTAGGELHFAVGVYYCFVETTINGDGNIRVTGGTINVDSVISMTGGSW